MWSRALTRLALPVWGGETMLIVGTALAAGTDLSSQSGGPLLMISGARLTTSVASSYFLTTTQLH